MGNKSVKKKSSSIFTVFENAGRLYVIKGNDPENMPQKIWKYHSKFQKHVWFNKKKIKK